MEGPEFFDRAQADAVSLAKGAIDGPSFGHAHLGAANQRRDVRRIGVAVPDEAAGAAGFVNGCSEDPPARRWVRESFYKR